jgi:SAM-dependent methyltransferase
VKPSPELFDGQAQRFDDRAGFTPERARRIATAVLALGSGTAAELMVELGAGTGQLGRWLAADGAYVGVDLSMGMLDRFRVRLADDGPRRYLLIRADANHGWPLAEGVAGTIFGSRALHLLAPRHVADEAFRVAHVGGATLIVGRVERQADSLRARLAREMRRRLRAAGFEPRGEQHHRQLIEECVRRGALVVDPVTADEWSASASARQSLDMWRSLRGLGGVAVPDDVRRSVLGSLEAWAALEFGNVDRRFESEESYVLTALRLRAA